MAPMQDSPALVLNADFRPLSYFPLSLWSWQETVKAVFLDRVNIVSEYDHAVHSPSFSMRLPSVIALKEYIHLSRRPDRFLLGLVPREMLRVEQGAPDPGAVLVDASRHEESAIGVPA